MLDILWMLMMLPEMPAPPRAPDPAGSPEPLPSALAQPVAHRRGHPRGLKRDGGPPPGARRPVKRG